MLCSSLRNQRAQGTWLRFFYPTFPGGGPGVGLVLLRLVVSLHLLLEGVCAITSPGQPALSLYSLGLCKIILGTVILIGFLTPFAASATAIVYAANCVSVLSSAHGFQNANSMDAYDLMAESLALVLVGPGSLSLDSFLFGRREIIIPKGPHSSE